MLNVLFVPKLAILILDFKTDGDEITELSPFVEGFLALNEQHLTDGLRTLSLKTNSMKLSIEGYVNSFKAFTKLDSLYVTSRSSFHLPTSSLANFLHDNKVWSNLTVLHLDSGYFCSNRFDADVVNMLSIAALPLLADTFPKLLHLTITIHNPDETTMEMTTVNVTRTPHGLETLGFIGLLPYDWTYSTSTAISFASFLHQLFPKLKEVWCTVPSKWVEDVQEMLKKA